MKPCTSHHTSYVIVNTATLSKYSTSYKSANRPGPTNAFHSCCQFCEKLLPNFAKTLQTFAKLPTVLWPDNDYNNKTNSATRSVWRVIYRSPRLLLQASDQDRSRAIDRSPQMGSTGHLASCLQSREFITVLHGNIYDLPYDRRIRLLLAGMFRLHGWQFNH
jgi:hypothetical protein